MSVNFYHYHPGALLESISDHTRLASLFQNEVLQDEQSFVDYLNSYGLKDQFVDANGQLTLKHLPEDAETFLKILENRLKRSGKDFLTEINRLTYNPPRQLGATARTASSYTDQILGKQASASSTPKKSSTDLVLLKLRDDFFDAVLGKGTDEQSIERILSQLDTPAKQEAFRRFVIDDPRARDYKGASRVEDILAQEIGGRALGRATAQLSVPDGQTLFLSSLNSDTYKNLVALIKNNHGDPGIILSLSVDQIRQTGNPDLVSVTEDLLRGIRTLAAESIRSGVFDFDLSPGELETKFTLGHLLMLKNTFGNVRFQIEQMQNLAQHMKAAGEGKGFGRSDAPMQKFDAAKKQLEAALAGLGTATTPESAARVMQDIAKASGNMLRESILFKEQEKQGLSQYEANGRAGELGAYSVVGACVTIGTMGAAGWALGGTGAMGLGGLMMTKGSLVTAAGMAVGGTAQTTAHFSAVKFGGSEEMSLTEIAKGAFREQFMTGLGVLTGAQIGRAFMGIEKLQHLGQIAPRLARTLPGRGLVISAEKFQHLQKVAPRVAQALEGATSNMTIGGEYAITQAEIDPYVVALWALSGVLNRGVLSGLDDAIEGSMQASLARKLAGAASVLGKDISMEAGEEVLETLIAEGYITPDQVIQSAMAALQELGSSESLAKAVVKTMRSRSMGSGLDTGQQIQSETPPWEPNEEQIPALPDEALAPPTYNHKHPVRHNPPAQFLHELHNLKLGLSGSDTLILGRRHPHGFPINQDRPDISGSHAKIIFSNGRWLIQNLGSHQTFINNELVESPRRVRAGDLIRLGPEMEFVFPTEIELTNAATFTPAPPKKAAVPTTKTINKVWGSFDVIRKPQVDFPLSPFAPDAHLMASHHPAGFETLAREFGTDAQKLISVLEQNTSAEQGYYRLQDGSLQNVAGTSSSVDSEIYMAGDENSDGTVAGRDVLFHTHGRESPEPSKDDLTVLIARARLNPGVEQKQMSLGFVNGEKAGVAVLAEFDPETGITHLSFLSTAHARNNMDQQKLNDLATKVDAELATLSQTDLTFRAHLELGNGEADKIRKAMDINRRLLSGYAQAIQEGEVFYAEDPETIDGRESRKNILVDPDTGQIVALGTPQSLPSNIRDNPRLIRLTLVITHPLLTSFLPRDKQDLTKIDFEQLAKDNPSTLTKIIGMDKLKPELKEAFEDLIGLDVKHASQQQVDGRKPTPSHMSEDLTTLMQNANLVVLRHDLRGSPQTLTDNKIEATRAVLVKRGGEWYIKNTSGEAFVLVKKSGTSIRVKFGDEYKLNDGDTLYARIAPNGERVPESAHVVKFPESPKPDTAPPPQRFQDVYPNGIMFKSPVINALIALQAGSLQGEQHIKIGRNGNNNLIVSDSAVSREHGQIYYDQSSQKWFYKNLSRNKSIINNQELEVNESVEIQSGNILKIGLSVILIELPLPGQKPDRSNREEDTDDSIPVFRPQQLSPDVKAADIDPKIDPNFIHGDPHDNGFLPGKDTLENEFGDPVTTPPKLGQTEMQQLEDLALGESNPDALKQLTKIASAASGIRLTPTSGANVHKVVAAYLKQHRDGINPKPIPNQRIVVDLKSLPQATAALDPVTLNALAKIHDITIEIHSLTPDGDVNVQEYLSKSLTEKRAEAAKKGITGELRKHQEQEAPAIPSMPGVILDKMITEDEVFLDASLTDLGWREIPGGVIGARAKLSHNQGKWTLENLSDTGIVIHFKSGSSVLLNHGKTARLQSGDVVFAGKNQKGEPDPLTCWKFEAPDRSSKPQHLPTARTVAELAQKLNLPTLNLIASLGAQGTPITDTDYAHMISHNTGNSPQNKTTISATIVVDSRASGHQPVLLPEHNGIVLKHNTQGQVIGVSIITITPNGPRFDLYDLNKNTSESIVDGTGQISLDDGDIIIDQDGKPWLFERKKFDNAQAQVSKINPAKTQVEKRQESIAGYNNIFIEAPVALITAFGGREQGWKITKLNPDGTVNLLRTKSSFFYRGPEVLNNIPLSRIHVDMTIERRSGALDDGWTPVEFDEHGRLKVIKKEGEEILERVVLKERCQITQHIHQKPDQTGALAAQHPGFAFLRKATQLMSGENVLPKKTFDKLFETFPQQSNVKNCYLVAALHSMKISGLFEIFKRTNMREEANGTFKVRIPFGSKNGKWITVTENDLASHRNPNQDMYDERNNRVDERTSLHAINGSKGYAILEVAYMIALNGKVDRAQIEGGRGDNVLNFLFGLHAVNMSSGYRNMLHHIANSSYFISKTKEYLDRFDNRLDMATAVTPTKEGGDSKTFVVDGITFYHKHAYAIESVDRDSETVVVVNPHNPSIKIKLKYDQFSKVFAAIDAVRLNYDSLFQEFNTLVAEEQNPGVQP